jgi:hypothetical protein
MKFSIGRNAPMAMPDRTLASRTAGIDQAFSPADCCARTASTSSSMRRSRSAGLGFSTTSSKPSNLIGSPVSRSSVR